MPRASDGIRPSDKVVIEISHFITSTVVTKHDNAPLVKFQNEKR
jgi:hypothetical protein